MERSCGILMPVSSLPSRHGIGTFGKAAYKFIDFLADSGQTWWQILPIGPTGYGDSQYQSFSTFAGNPYFIDLDMLVQDGLLRHSEADWVNWGSDPSKVDYGAVYANRGKVLWKAFQRGWDSVQREAGDFASRQAWIQDYSLFMALKEKYGMRAWSEWPDDIRMRREPALSKARSELADKIRYHVFVQYLFSKQWTVLRGYARGKGIKIIGDVPIYVSMDSADVWADPSLFQLDGDLRPVSVAGVPPDYFSKDGQLWGNPLYNWDRMKSDGYGWWIRRIEGASRWYDAIRIDHFRGLESYWAVPAGEKTAKNGVWKKGPGLSFVTMLTQWFNGVQFIAEDLGILTPEVKEMLEESGLPGMKVLEFAFSSPGPGDYQPHRYTENCVCYVGTHDNSTAEGWSRSVPKKEFERARKYFGLNKEEGTAWGLIRGGMESSASLFIAQMQDYLELGDEARMNLPGTVGGNWTWRILPGQLSRSLSRKIADISARYERSSTCLR